MPTKKKKEKTYDAIEFLDNLIGEPMTFGSLLHNIRICDEISQADFAYKLGISSSHLCDIEKGRKLVSPKKAIEYARILKDSQVLFLQVALQDQVNQTKKPFIVELKTKAA